MEQEEIRKKRNELAEKAARLRDELYEVYEAWDRLSDMCRNPFHNLPENKQKGKECPDCGIIQIKKWTKRSKTV